MLYKTAFSIYKSTINIGNREISYELTAGACPQGHPENRHDCKGGTLSQDKYEGNILMSNKCAHCPDKFNKI